MKRYILLGLLVFFQVMAYAQMPRMKINKVDRMVTYSETIATTEPAKKLYNSAKKWLLVFSQQEREYEDFSEQDNSWILMGKSNINIGDGIRSTIFYQITYEEKKYSYVVKLLEVEYKGRKLPFSKLLEPEANTTPFSKNAVNRMTNSTYNNVSELLTILRSYMENGGE